MSMRHVVACGKLSHPPSDADIRPPAIAKLCDTPRRRSAGEEGTVVISLGQNFKIPKFVEFECASA